MSTGSPPNEMTSTQTVQYKVKLYGHTSEDSERFSRDLAVLLAIEESRARELLASVPVIIATTPSKEQAEHFQQQIGLIRGLCLVEAEGTGGAAAGPREEGPKAPAADAPDLDLEMQEEKDSFLSNVWLGALVGVTGIALIVGVTIFLGQWWRTSVANRPAPVPVRTESTQPQKAAAPAVSGAVTEDLLKEKIEQLRSEFRDLQFQSRWQTDELNKLYKRRPVPYEEIRRMKVLIAKTQKRMRSVKKEIGETSDKLSRR